MCLCIYNSLVGCPWWEENRSPPWVNHTLWGGVVTCRVFFARARVVGLCLHLWLGLCFYVYAYIIHWWAARGGKRIDRRLGLTIPYGVALFLVEYCLRVC